jgi:hypothetical protein
MITTVKSAREERRPFTERLRPISSFGVKPFPPDSPDLAHGAEQTRLSRFLEAIHMSMAA